REISDRPPGAAPHSAPGAVLRFRYEFFPEPASDRCSRAGCLPACGRWSRAPWRGTRPPAPGARTPAGRAHTWFLPYRARAPFQESRGDPAQPISRKHDRVPRLRPAAPVSPAPESDTARVRVLGRRRGQPDIHAARLAPGAAPTLLQAKAV